MYDEVIAYSCLCYVGAVVGCHSIHPIRSSETSRAYADKNNFDDPSHQDPILVEKEVFASRGRPDFASDPSKTLATSENGKEPASWLVLSQFCGSDPTN
jgi:hypothetical protein